MGESKTWVYGRLHDMSAGGADEIWSSRSVCYQRTPKLRARTEDYYFVHRDVNLEVADRAVSVLPRFLEPNIRGRHSTIRKVAKTPEEDYEEARFQNVDSVTDLSLPRVYLGLERSK